MRDAFRAPSGTHDVLFPESARWETLVAAFSSLVGRAGYGLVISPMFEDERVFLRGIGAGSDVASKEMYSFEDRGARRLALRPEGTASVVRAFVQHRPASVWKAWYVTPAFRYERPQAARYRQHHQLGIEAIGSEDPDLDVEVIALAAQFYRHVGLESVELRLNSMGCAQCRPGFERSLVEWLEANAAQLCPEHSQRWSANPLRVLDCKNELCLGATAQAPQICDALCTDCNRHFARVKEGLDSLRVAYLSAPRLVRGFDYYTRTTFEFSSPSLAAAQNGVGGGGRYDGLAEALGGPAAPAVGFGIGIERLLLACDAQDSFPVPEDRMDVFVIDLTGGRVARELTHELRNAGVRGDRAFEERSLKAQMRAADRSGAKLAVIVGPSEQEAGKAVVRQMMPRLREESDARRDGAQELVDSDAVVERVLEMLRR
jgi:histidyl-tRNA synthetase